jgi:drug/metabolite transporter (DMT)-like permease
MPAAAVPRTQLTPRAFVTLLAIAAMFGANHVAARFAFDAGVDVATAVAVRSLTTALVVAAIVRRAGVPVALEPRARRVMPLIGLLVAVQSLALYSAVARIPVGLALLAFNTWPLWT